MRTLLFLSDIMCGLMFITIVVMNILNGKPDLTYAALAALVGLRLRMESMTR